MKRGVLLLATLALLVLFASVMVYSQPTLSVQEKLRNVKIEAKGTEQNIPLPPESGEGAPQQVSEQSRADLINTISKNPNFRKAAEDAIKQSGGDASAVLDKGQHTTQAGEGEGRAPIINGMTVTPRVPYQSASGTTMYMQLLSVFIPQSGTSTLTADYTMNHAYALSHTVGTVLAYSYFRSPNTNFAPYVASLGVALVTPNPTSFRLYVNNTLVPYYYSGGRLYAVFTARASNGIAISWRQNLASKLAGMVVNYMQLYKL
jgi:cell division protein FtsL